MRQIALPLGLVDIKVCAVDEVWFLIKANDSKGTAVSGPNQAWSRPLARHGESSTGFDFMKQFQQLATVHPPRRASGGSFCFR